MVEECFTRSEGFMSDYHERCKKYYSLYRAERKSFGANVVTRSQYVVPLCYKTVETILPRLVSVVFSVSPPIQSRYRVPPAMGQGMAQLRNLDQCFDYHSDKYFFFETIEGWIKNALIYGQSYVKVGWRVVKRMVKNRGVAPSLAGQILKEEDLDLLPDDVKPMVEMVDVDREEEEVLEDRLDVSLVDNLDLFFSPEACFPDPFGTAKYVIHRSRKRKSELVNMKESGLYLDFDESQLSQAQDESSAEQKANAISKGQSSTPDSDDPMVTVYEYWENDRVITTANHKVLLRDEANPFGLPGKSRKKPFVALFDTLAPGDLFQIGEVEPLEHTQIEMSTLRRMRTDNNNLIINKMYLYDKDAEVDTESFELARPGGGVGARPQGRSLNDVLVPIMQGDINGASYKEFEDLDKDGQEISGLLDYAVGASPDRRETATTVQLLQTAANMRMDVKVRNTAYCMARLGEMMHERWKQLLTRPIPIPIPSEEGGGVEMIDRDSLPDTDVVDLVCPGSPGMLMKDARHQKIMQMYQGLMTNPMANPMAALQMFVVGMKESEIDGIEPIIKLLESPNPMAVQPGMPQAPGVSAPGGTPPNAGTPAAPTPPSAPGIPQMNEFANVMPQKGER